MVDYFKTDLENLHQALVNKDLSSAELVKETFAKIETIDPKIEAFLALNKEQTDYTKLGQ